MISKIRQRFTTSRWTILALVPLILLSLSGYARSEPAGLTGSWSGGGWFSLSAGPRERARCSAHYSGSGPVVSVSATCATDSTKVSQSATLRQTGANTYSGDFFNAQYNVSGTIHVVVRGNTQSVTLTS